MYNLFKKIVLFVVLFQFSVICFARKLTIVNDTDVNWWISDVPGKSTQLVNSHNSVVFDDLSSVPITITISSAGEVQLVLKGKGRDPEEYVYHVKVAKRDHEDIVFHINEDLLIEVTKKLGEAGQIDSPSPYVKKYKSHIINNDIEKGVFNEKTPLLPKRNCCMAQKAVYGCIFSTCAVGVMGLSYYWVYVREMGKL